ncbi:Nse4-domain-containing protein [Pleomassaria siparia CBS 279.74]|uniref:Non-structural maintenance of chromosomes element 4 n=1 Tax=Pleomassaria siparia CBS 279.74 TaxID=1314801 RepID=A0A6G1KRR2_9PLEO|nr:Nse4-domain-containing protein [Pleomassaria siparia CBS 279.74]
MARLNTHLSATPQPQPGRSSTVDSLYRDPTPQSRLRASTARESSYSVMSPVHSSDKENDEPESRDNTPHPPTKGLGHRQMATPRLPTPSSGASSGGHASKRRRTDDYSVARSANIFIDEDAAEMDDEEDEAADDTARTGDADDADELTRYYDPNQDPEERRVIRVGIRNNERDLAENRDEYLKPDNDGLYTFVGNTNRVFGKVKNTSEAALEARVLVQASEIATKRLDMSLNDNSDVKIDVDQFVSKCIFFMKSGGKTHANGEETAHPSTQARNRRQTAATQADDEDDDDDSGDGLDWAVLGREACFPCNRRPPVSSFLLGPLSVQKRVRAVQSRRGKSQRQPTGPTTRPQELTQADLQSSENSNLTNVVTKIRARLEEHITTASEMLDASFDESMSDDQIAAACRQHRVYQTPVENEEEDADPCVSLFDFVVNPKSFGQTVENIFYVSFLIKEGNLKVLHDNDGLPLLVPCQPHSLEEHREQQVQKHQAIFSLDYRTWRNLIQAFDIKEPLIPHRIEEEATVTAGGWYS